MTCIEIVVRHTQKIARKRNILFCGFTLDVIDEHGRNTLNIREKFSNGTDSETGVLPQSGLSITGNFK